MLNRIRNNVSAPMLLAFLALFVALAGGAYAASKAKKNSVVTKSIRSNAVTTSKLKDASVTNVKLGLTCKTGTQSFGGACWETTARNPAHQPEAENACTGAGGVLPDANELVSFATTSGITLDGPGRLAA
jgi:hypothetical protein